MNQKNLEICKSLINPSYIEQSSQAINQYNHLINVLLTQRRLPDKGWDDQFIRWFLNDIAKMDSNNYVENAGVGEREGRIHSRIVQERHFGLAHGIGRSGDISEQQPKAAGSSLVQRLCSYLVMDSMSVAGLNSIGECLVLPMATGMTIALTLMTFTKHCRPPTAKYVIWPRIDQKSCLKAIATAGLVPVVIENVLQGDVITTDLEAIENKIIELGPENVVCVYSTTSCFAPRVPDRIIEISELCYKYNVGHIINNAYGLQCSKIVHAINESCQSDKQRRVDAIIQSTDKNYMVPVGGAIITSPKKEKQQHKQKEKGEEEQQVNLIDLISKNYPGRANGSPILDLFITLLSMGRQGYKELLDERKQLLTYFRDQLASLSLQFPNCRLLDTPDNRISLGLALAVASGDQQKLSISMIGSKLFSRSCSGARVIELPGSKKSVAGLDFESYGSHINNYHSSYLTVACAIGITKDDIDTFMKRLKKIL
ncbi:O-phosphoseryl-tRNA selenium transferase [Cavenderia fasciculata]|uniref:O-phosphoseryl-tRNA(Sec) selenium transferase n=1 Tax=Cavenderia fasciculata TaxID=261658 RepID=F4PUC7_CACFS|nr:O-phosphoseryl-tRNA selenium transferase [Cavenderia fasciculata]EGG21842.1 O-phosphoseryl-tRNA selenium transferase [Cavenderia fasciculata]|eukprot:XP_004359692.1 O-phosphoseryl-tRNA selenium transferase [Cavenderia fasciculata]